MIVRVTRLAKHRSSGNGARSVITGSRQATAFEPATQGLTDADVDAALAYAAELTRDGASELPLEIIA